MHTIALLLLRISLGFLMIIWGLHKVLDPEHSKIVIETHYFHKSIESVLIEVFGVIQTVFGALIVLGYLRTITYPFLMLGTATTLIAVFPSIIDPWGWYLQGTNVLFYPSLTIFAGALVLSAFRQADALALDKTRLYFI